MMKRLQVTLILCLACALKFQVDYGLTLGDGSYFG